MIKKSARPPIERVCPVCNKTYLAHQYRLEAGQALVCSRACQRKQTLSKFQKKCLTCGKEFVATSKNGKYCSTECRTGPRKRTVLKNCVYCGKEFRTTPGKQVGGRGKYCSKGCLLEDKSRPPYEQFANNVYRDDGEDACWPYVGVLHKAGYGTIKYRTASILAHRFAFEDAFGPIPPWLKVCHRCDNPPCCNKRHLFLGTDADNWADMRAKGRHVRGEKNPLAKLTEAIVREIRTYPEGVKDGDIAKIYHVATETIRLARKSIQWKHVS